MLIRRKHHRHKPTMDKSSENHIKTPDNIKARTKSNQAVSTKLDKESIPAYKTNGQVNGHIGQANGHNGHAVGTNGHQHRNGRLHRNGKLSSGRRIRKPRGWLDWATLVCGMLVGVGVGSAYAWLLYMLHENRLWFSHIKEVEREISFRTEAGLYYSYYKQFVNAPTISEGFNGLIHDNITENWRTINVLQRFNIYQEVVLGFIYRVLPCIQSRFLPIFFYINTVFALHGIYIVALYVTTWLLSNSWLAGLLACAFYITNKDDTTRIDYTIPLRESFALPFLYVQIMFITYYLRPMPQPKKQMISLGFIVGSTFLFVLTWQFAQFILLLQALALYCGAVTKIIPQNKVVNIFGIQLFSILVVCCLQFFNKMLLGSLAVSFIISALADFKLQTGRKVVTSIVGQLLRLLSRLIFVFAAMFVINFAIKILIGLDADQHIFKFITAKFGLAHARDFDVLLYKCHSAFAFLPLDAFKRLTSSLLFPIYIAVVFGLLSVMVVAVFQNWRFESQVSASKKDDDLHHPSTSSSSSPPLSPSSQKSKHNLMLRRPDLAYHALQTVPFGLMALAVRRMSYVWAPQMCVLAALGISNESLWRWLLGKLRCNSETIVQCLRHTTAILVIAMSLYRCVPRLSSELNELREFYDPDTVELMNWISQQTPKTAVFSGSMQLLAGVKLCTGRRLTNHPHYEDKQLRDKTLEVYQYYARRSAKEVYDIHRETETDYLILEDSICYARPSDVGCRLTDIMDIMNGHLYSGADPLQEPDLKPATIGRFCDVIKKGGRDFSQLFKLVFQNRTFRIYQLLTQ